MSTFTTYRNSLDTQLVECNGCGYKKITPINTKWKFPCDITYHCSKCENVYAIYYSDSSILADDVAMLKASRGILV